MELNRINNATLMRRFKTFVLRLLMIFFLGTNALLLPGQCITASAADIPDGGTLTIEFIVSGLIDNDLSSLTQGICEVDLNFTHEYLGDLTITLISPSGTTVVLVGPVTTAITAPNLTRWNVSFVPCMTTPSPDAGFTPVWSNLQAWQSFTTYTGSYHPQSGCLENFNTGPANGVWQLIIEDHDVLQVGTLTSASIIFCNPAGLQCEECDPNAGILSPSNITRCVGQNISSSEIIVDFGGNPPSPASYSYQFLMTSGNTIVQSGSFFSDTPPVGNYVICGLNYLTVDSSAINALLNAGDYNQLVQAISAGNVCGEFSSTCVALEIIPVPDTTNIDVNLCEGESYSFGGQVYSLMGIYFQTHDGPGLCDSVFQIQITTSSLNIDFEIPDTLHCSLGDVMLNSIITGNAGPVIYDWSTQVGNITGPTNLSSITVDQPGQYFLSISDSFCTGVKSLNVIAEQGYPQVFVNGGTITCTNPSITLDPIYIPTNADILWTGPSGFMSTQPVITVSVAGNYLLSVSNQNGCTIKLPLVIGLDTGTVDFEILPLGKNCQQQTLTLGSSYESVSAWNWTGPNNFSSTYWRPDITLPGDYMLDLVFNNGCIRTNHYFFDGDFSIPDITVSASDTIHCNEVIPLFVNSTTPGVTYSWVGPGGFLSIFPFVQVAQAGTYTATVNASNGCISQENVIIYQGSDIFNYLIETDTLTCAKDTIQISAISSEADLFKWIGFPGPDSLSSTISITTPGIYSVMMTDTNSGCQIRANVEIISDTRYTSFGYTATPITCADPVSHLTFVPFVGYTYTDVYWVLPDQTIVPGPLLDSSLPGEHLLNGNAPNGCIGTWHIYLPYDTIKPSLFLEGGTLGCDDTLDIVTFSQDSITGYQWSGPGIVSNSGDKVSVTKPGSYHLVATALNGCSSEYDILIDSNTIIPTYEIFVDSLECDHPARIEATSPDAMVEYLWTDSADNILSTDSVVDVNFPGLISFEIKGPNNCKASDTVLIHSPEYPSIEILYDTLTCTNSQVTLEGNSTTAPVTYEWSDINGNQINTTQQINVSDVGPYILAIIAQNSCKSLDTIIVPADTIPPDAQIQLIGEVRCQNRDVKFDGTGSVPGNLSFSWSSLGGSIVGDNSIPIVDARDTGLYVLMVTRSDNGCRDSDSFHLAESPEAIFHSLLTLKSPACSGDSNASIQVFTVQGGVPPLLYQLDTGLPQASDIFENLKAGNYVLHIIDDAGCIYDTSITIMPVSPFTVDAGPDQEIFLGESATVSGSTDLDPDQILSQQWDSLGVMLCDDCPLFDFNPLTTTTYRYRLESLSGCIMTDEVTIYVLEQGRYYIGNIFTPNGDNVNDVIMLYASPGVVKVNKWIIFDRWGNAVFGRTDFQPNDPNIFWDGRTTTGENLNPGVFSYLLELELLNGSSETYHGDITLLR